jgi:hypothetical protein
LPSLKAVEVVVQALTLQFQVAQVVLVALVVEEEQLTKTEQPRQELQYRGKDFLVEQETVREETKDIQVVVVELGLLGKTQQLPKLVTVETVFQAL